MGYGEPPVGGDRDDRRDAVLVGQQLVVLTERRSDVDQPRAVLGRHVVRGQDDVAVRVAEVVGERRRVAPADEIRALHPGDHPGRQLVIGERGVTEQLRGIRPQPGLGEDVALGTSRVVRLDDDVVDVRADGRREVARQRPRRRRPHQGQLAGLEPAADGDRRVLADPVGLLVHPQLVRGQRGLVVPAVGQHPEALIDQPLVVELLEGPQDALHEARVERLVVVVEVDPPRLAGDVGPPLVGVRHDRLAALGVEGLDPQLEDLLLGLDPELAHRLELGRQAVGVPPETPVDPVPAHRLVAGDDVLDVAGEQVAVVRQAVGERRAVVEDELVAAVLARGPVLDRGPERVVGRPVGEHRLLDLREPRAGGDAEGRAGVLGGRGDLGVGHRGTPAASRSSRACHEDDIAAGVCRSAAPRYHLACRTSPPRGPRHTTARSRAVTGPPVRV